MFHYDVWCSCGIIGLDPVAGVFPPSICHQSTIHLHMGFVQISKLLYNEDILLGLNRACLMTSD